MARRHAAEKRLVIPDPKFGNQRISQFINVVMQSGKKSVAERIVYSALDVAAAKIGDTPLGVFDKAVERIMPKVEVRSRRVGGANYQIPVEVNEKRGFALTLRWLTGAARKRSEKGMELRMAGELVDAINGRGAAYKKREASHSMAEANRAFSHYRW